LAIVAVTFALLPGTAAAWDASGHQPTKVYTVTVTR
jgi:hypothetical protein